MKEAPNILFCNCAYLDATPQAVRGEVLEGLCRAGAAFEAVADLCELAARRDPVLGRLARARRLRIAACFPRAVRWLFAAAGAKLPAEGVTIANMRAEPAKQVLESLLESIETPGRAVRVDRDALIAKPGHWVPWFPVIEYDRCTNCRQCLGFCLFGVFGLSADGKVEVRSPEKCKTNCPACARVCPTAAIIFPKYSSGPINGDEVRPGDLEGHGVKVDLASLVAGDVYAKLRSRGAQNAKNANQAEHVECAECAEHVTHVKKACCSGGQESGPGDGLARVGKQLGIPQDVLDCLCAGRQSCCQADAPCDGPKRDSQSAPSDCDCAGGDKGSCC